MHTILFVLFLSIVNGHIVFGMEEGVITLPNRPLSPIEYIHDTDSQIPTQNTQAIELVKKIDTKKVEKVRNELDKEKDNALFRAVKDYNKKENNVDLISQLLKNKADVNAPHHDSYYDSAYWFKADKEYLTFVLHEAIYHQSLDLLKVLLEHGAVVDMPRTRDGATPLYLAAEIGFIQGVKELIERGASVEGTGSSVPLKEASHNGWHEIVKLLIEKGADLKRADDLYNGLPIHDAATYGHPKVVEQFLNAGMDINVVDARGRSPLHHAADNSYDFGCGVKEMITFLVAHGATIDLQDNKGNTPLHLAAKEDHFTAGECLIEQGATFDIVNKEGKTAYDVAILNGNFQMVQLFQKKGAVSMLCGSKSNEEILNDAYLIARSNKKDMGTLLIKAIRNKNIDAVKFILEKKVVNINEFLEDRLQSTTTCLLVAVLHDAKEIAQLLLHYGADATLRAKNYYYSPLDRAIENRSYSMVALLLKGTVEYTLGVLPVCEHQEEACACSEYKKKAIELLEPLIKKKEFRCYEAIDYLEKHFSKTTPDRLALACKKNNLQENVYYDVVYELVRRSLVGKEGKEFEKLRDRLQLAMLLDPLYIERAYHMLFLGTVEPHNYDDIFASLEEDEDTNSSEFIEKKQEHEKKDDTHQHNALVPYANQLNITENNSAKRHNNIPPIHFIHAIKKYIVLLKKGIIKTPLFLDTSKRANSQYYTIPLDFLAKTGFTKKPIALESANHSNQHTPLVVPDNAPRGNALQAASRKVALGEQGVLTMQNARAYLMLTKRDIAVGLLAVTLTLALQEMYTYIKTHTW